MACWVPQVTTTVSSVAATDRDRATQPAMARRSLIFPAGSPYSEFSAATAALTWRRHCAAGNSAGSGRPGGEMAGQRPGERLGKDVVALGVDAPAAPDVLVEQALVDEAGQGGLHRDRRMPVDELP